MAPIRGEAAQIVEVRWTSSAKQIAEQSGYRGLTIGSLAIGSLGVLATCVLLLQVAIQQLSPTLPEQHLTAAAEAATTERGIVRIFNATRGQPALVIRRNGSIELKQELADGSASTRFMDIGCLPIIHRDARSGQLVVTSGLGELSWSNNIVVNGFEEGLAANLIDDRPQERVVEAIALTDRSAAYTRTASGTIEHWMIDRNEATVDKLRRTVLPVPTAPNCLAASPSGRLLACAYNGGGWAVYDHETGTARVWSIPSTETTVRALAWAPDERRILAVSSGGVCTLLNIETHSYDWQNKVDAGDLISVAIDSSGTRFAAGGVFKQMVIGDLKSGHVEHAALGHRGTVTTITFSSDDQYVCTGSTDGVLRVWNAANGQLTRETF